jgi:hypothetical protein
MPRCSEAALETALRQLSEHATSRRARSNWISTYLVAQRMHAAGYDFATGGAPSGVDKGVNDLFVLLPDHPNGRNNPFVDLSSKYRWTLVKGSGRATVWNNGTRTHPQTVLFNQEPVGNEGRGHFANGLRPDAVDVLLQHLGADDEPLPGRDALAVLLTRNHNWPSEPSRQDLHDAARAMLDLSHGDFERITSDAALGVPVLGTPEWSPELLATSELGPPAAGAPAVEMAAPAGVISIDSVRELPEQFRKFLGSYGVATAGHDELVDLLAAAMSAQFVIMAGPSGSGKSLMASALGAFFAPKERRCRLEASRLLAKPEEFLGYYSHLAGQKFMAYDQLLSLLDLDVVPDGTPPMIAIEEANLSPIEGYLSPLVHGLGGSKPRSCQYGSTPSQAKLNLKCRSKRSRPSSSCSLTRGSSPLSTSMLTPPPRPARW